MRTAQPGDRVRVRYVKRFEDGSVASSRVPVELTVGVDDPRLPGLGLALVGLLPGGSTTVCVAPGRAYAPAVPGRVRLWPRTRFPQGQVVAPGEWVRFRDPQGRTRRVRILEVRAGTVLVDTNRRGAGQGLELAVELVGIGASAPSRGGEPLEAERPKVLALDVDAATLASLRQAFPDWQVEAVAGTTPTTLEKDWNPGKTELLLIGARTNLAETLGLCRELRSQAGRSHTAIVVLVTPGQNAQVRAALESQADGCLVLPVHAKDLVDLAARVRPGRHTLGLEPAQRPNP